MPVTAPAAIDHSITLNDLRLNYREWPNEGAQPLVLLHGFTGHARSWDSFAEAMQPGYRVLALDQRGHGESEWATDYAPERNVDDLNAFVRALGLQQFALLGLSMGGRNVMTYAPLHPEEVERLVIVDIGPEVATAGSARIRAGVQARDIFDDPEEAVASMRAGNARAPQNPNSATAASITSSRPATANGPGSTTPSFVRRTALFRIPIPPAPGSCCAKSPVRRSSCAGPKATSSAPKSLPGWSARSLIAAWSPSRKAATLSPSTTPAASTNP